MWQVLYVLLVMDRLDLLGCACVLFSRASVSYYRAGQPPGDCVAERNWARVRLAEKRRQGVPAEKLYTISDGPICLVFFYSRLVLVFQVRVQGRMGHHSVRLATTLVCCNTNSASYGGSTQSFE